MSSKFLARFFVILFLSYIPALNAAEIQKTEALKVAYLYYFSKFISWPEEVQSEMESLNLCAGEVNENIRFQLGTIDGKKVGQKTLHVVYLEPDDDSHYADREDKNESVIERCNILFVSNNMIDWYHERLARVPEHALVVAESESVARRVILLHRSDNKLKFEIDNDIAIQKGLKISSKLLKLSQEKSR
ncbi:YfiR family protein [Aliikangiella sp. G2MR2-5]|uniref:YfiR family protein n=1 Tax=Aliikangiella sp. G2MR2-5 TaxID=2788943 RepID=UPI0018A9CE8B